MEMMGRTWDLEPDKPGVPPITATQILTMYTSWQNHLKFRISEIFKNGKYPQFLWCQNLISQSIWEDDLNWWESLFILRNVNICMFHHWNTNTCLVVICPKLAFKNLKNKNSEIYVALGVSDNGFMGLQHKGLCLEIKWDNTHKALRTRPETLKTFIFILFVTTIKM